MSRRGHRHAPRRIGEAVDRVLDGVVPPGGLAEVQRAWPAAAGPTLAARATPVALRDGRLVVACGEAVWAQELSLLGPVLVERLAALAPSAGVREVRTRAGA